MEQIYMKSTLLMSNCKPPQLFKTKVMFESDDLKFS